MKQPSANVNASSAGKLRWSVQKSTGIAAISGTRAASARFIVRFAPSRAIRLPLGMPRSPTGRSSAARTQPIFAVEPVVTRTNQGSATYVIAEPLRDTSSATTTAARDRFLSRLTGEIVRRTYGFVKWKRAESVAAAPRGAPGADPGGRAPRLRPP